MDQFNMDEAETRTDEGGSSTHDVRATSPYQQAQHPINQAMELLSPDEKSSYIQAMERCPEIVATETDPQLFLSFESMQAGVAARRLAMYWTYRERFFGTKRAFRPLVDLSIPPSRRALSSADVEELQHGALAKVPPDRHGRPILLVDRYRLRNADYEPDPNRWVRISFFWLTKMMHQPDVQRNGMVVVKIMRGQNLDRKRMVTSQMLMRDAMACRVNSIHLCCLPPKGGCKTFADTLVPIMFNFSQRLLGTKANIHVASSSESMLTQLEPHGFRKASVPTTLGGKWSYTKFDTLVTRLLSESFLMARNLPTDLKQSPLINDQHERLLMERVQRRKSGKRKIDATFISRDCWAKEQKFVKQPFAALASFYIHNKLSY